jgi:DNA-nicking Smr family endonuclease
MAKKAKPPPGFNTPFSAIKLPQPAPEAAPEPVRPPPQAKPRPEFTDDDMRVFEQAMSGVKPLSSAQRQRQRAAVPGPPPRRSRAASDDALAHADLADLVQPHDRFTLDEAGETVTGLAPGIDRKLLHRLRAGDYPVEAELHRRSRVEAGLELERFLARARADGRRCVLVIHGRGHNSGPEGPVLLAATRDWLTQAPLRRHVLAFASAPPSLGGTGAMLVLLRRGER